MEWLHNFKDPDGVTASWLEKVAAFEYESVHHSRKSLGHVESMSGIPSQHATTGKANSSTHGAEAKNPTQNNDEVSDTEWQTVLRRAREENQSPTRRSKQSQDGSNSISICETMNKREVNKNLTLCR